MVWFKCCPRCERGDMVLEEDEYGPRVKCIQCSYAKDLNARPQAFMDLEQMLRRESQRLAI